MDSVFIPAPEVAAKLGISEALVYQWLRADIIPHQSRGRRKLIHRAEFERWMAEGKTQTAQPVQVPSMPNSQSVSINANGLTLEISISIKADEGRQLRPVVSIR